MICFIPGLSRSRNLRRDEPSLCRGTRGREQRTDTWRSFRVWCRKAGWLYCNPNRAQQRLGDDFTSYIPVDWLGCAGSHPCMPARQVRENQFAAAAAASRECQPSCIPQNGSAERNTRLSFHRKVAEHRRCPASSLRFRPIAVRVICSFEYGDGSGARPTSADRHVDCSHAGDVHARQAVEARDRWHLI